jgi:hypothetical protein
MRNDREDYKPKISFVWEDGAEVSMDLEGIHHDWLKHGREQAAKEKAPEKE